MGTTSAPTTCLQLKPSNDPRAPGYAHTSGHKGVVYKYLVATTLQGTPIFVSPCMPGRRHDAFLFQVPLKSHRVNDFALLDGGFPGLNGHARIPIRKPVRPNASLSRARARIEREFSCLKRFRILAATRLKPAQHEKFVMLVVRSILLHPRIDWVHTAPS
jgi:hypothetical protein